jgi:NAD(P)-dependent dehydrogenase (short-subunit alcohol dehydrogenase family)
MSAGSQQVADDRSHAIVLGASKEGGTGWAIAEALAPHCSHITVGARSLQGIGRLAEMIGGKAIACDVTVEEQVETFVKQAVAAGGPVQHAILVAGEGIRGYIDDISEAELRRAFDLNWFGPVYFLRHIARHMREGGAVVLMSSIAATNPWPGYFSYGSAKAALQTLVRYAALEYAPRGIRVNALIPGPIHTPTASATLSNPRLRAAVFREVPLGRTTTTSEVAEASVWLARSAPWITGECLHIDGGMHLRRPPYPDEMQAAMNAPD